MKHSILYRSAVLLNFFSDLFYNSYSFKQFSTEVKRDLVFKDLILIRLSAQLIFKSVNFHVIIKS